MRQLVCPVSEERIDERVTRINALWVVLLVIGGFLFNTTVLLVFLSVDFYIRAFTKLKYSPVSFLSSRLVNTFQLEKKIIDKAPKIFAARLGFLMSLTIIILLLSGFNTISVRNIKISMLICL